jgi:hypothetical protein
MGRIEFMDPYRGGYKKTSEKTSRLTYLWQTGWTQGDRTPPVSSFFFIKKWTGLRRHPIRTPPLFLFLFHLYNSVRMLTYIPGDTVLLEQMRFNEIHLKRTARLNRTTVQTEKINYFAWVSIRCPVLTVRRWMYVSLRKIWPLPRTGRIDVFGIRPWRVRDLCGWGRTRMRRYMIVIVVKS